jgi:hypothetical protein
VVVSLVVIMVAITPIVALATAVACRGAELVRWG